MTLPATAAHYLATAIKAAGEASRAILSVYESGSFGTETKTDESPLTIADTQSNDIIKSHLKKTGLPVLSEEDKLVPFADRKQWEYFWMVDPLDGTKEFIKQNGEFTVNIALIQNNKPILGVIVVPVKATCYFASGGGGAWKQINREEPVLLPVKDKKTNLSAGGLRVVASRSHRDNATQAFLDQLADPQIVSMGSSLKFMLLVEGMADIYPRFAPTMEWDTAAAQAILSETGHSVISEDTKMPLTYNKENLLNPYFIAV
ncbi:MAG: 3'(2'),5'-bisphosphate nucleotidase CysQ [Bacteroidota bacterium]|nr:3'(2'),5'-bisphosphate nucleotidase CysQ [Bacteroidota bacterium]